MIIEILNILGYDLSVSNRITGEMVSLSLSPAFDSEREKYEEKDFTISPINPFIEYSPEGDLIEHMDEKITALTKYKQLVENMIITEEECRE